MTKILANLAEKYAKLGATSVLFVWHQPKAPKSLLK